MLAMAAPLLDEAGSARPAMRRRTEGGAVDFALVSLGEASHGGYLLAFRDEGEAACFQGLGVGVGWDGDGQVMDRRLQGVVSVLARVCDVADDQHLSDSAAATVSSRERVVEDYHVGGAGVE